MNRKHLLLGAMGLLGLVWLTRDSASQLPATTARPPAAPSAGSDAGPAEADAGQSDGGLPGSATRPDLAMPPPPTVPVPPGRPVEQLPCFQCHHQPAVFWHGPKFPHSQHRELGHCHVCHTISGHFEVGVRRELCAECH